MTTFHHLAVTPEMAQLVEQANATKAEFEGVPVREHTKVLKRLIDAADVALGIYFNAGNLGIHVIKGQRVVEAVASAREGLPATVRVIHVRDPEEAEAMRRVYGDGSSEGVMIQ